MVEQPMEKICEKAVELLLRRVEGEDEEAPVKICFGTKIQKGESVRSI